MVSQAKTGATAPRGKRESQLPWAVPALTLTFWRKLSGDVRRVLFYLGRLYFSHLHIITQNRDVALILWQPSFHTGVGGGPLQASHWEGFLLGTGSSDESQLWSMFLSSGIKLS